MPRLLYRGASDLYIPHETYTGDFDGNGDEEYCSGYWIASPNAFHSSTVFVTKFNGFLGSDVFTGGWVTDRSFGVRPVVCLSPNVRFVKSDSVVGNGENECFELVE